MGEKEKEIKYYNTNLTRLKLSKLIYFFEYEMYKRAKYKNNPKKYFPLNEVFESVINWDPTYKLYDISLIYNYWVNIRLLKPLIRKFQQPPDTNDDDSNIAFR